MALTLTFCIFTKFLPKTREYKEVKLRVSLLPSLTHHHPHHHPHALLWGLFHAHHTHFWRLLHAHHHPFRIRLLFLFWWRTTWITTIGVFWRALSGGFTTSGHWNLDLHSLHGLCARRRRRRASRRSARRRSTRRCSARRRSARRRSARRHSARRSRVRGGWVGNISILRRCRCYHNSSQETHRVEQGQ